MKVGDLVKWKGPEDHGCLGVIIKRDGPLVKIRWTDGTMGVFINTFDNLEVINDKKE